MHAPNYALRSNTGPDAWCYEEVVSPKHATATFDDIIHQSGVTDEMIFMSQRNHDAFTTQRIYSLVFTKENIQKLGFRNLIKQMRSKLGNVAALPTCEVRLSSVDYIAEVPAESSIKTVTPTLPSLKTKDEKYYDKYILHNINAIFKPGTMTLVLGPPGCGKTSLLKLVAGLIKPKSHESLTGTVTYNGCMPEQVDLPSLTTYVQQQDNHIATLTVQETFAFAHKCLVGQIAPDDPLAVNEEHMVDILISVFGLTECANTMIGDDMIRGVSGGQKRRVTVGEMLTGRASALLIDEFSNGLDASTTYDIAKAIGTMAELLEKTVVMSMLQPPPEVYELFDNVIVLDKGEMVYGGPRTDLVPYFRSIGYVLPPRKDIADFLQEVTTPLGVRYAKKGAVPISSPAEFAAAFYKSPLAAQLGKELLAASGQPRQKLSVRQRRVPLKYTDSLRVVFGRMIKTSLRDKKFNKSRMVNALLLGVILGTVFLGIATKATTPTQETQYAPMKVGLLFAAILFQALATLNSIQAGIERRSVLYKQLSFNFFPVSTYVASEFVLELLWTIPQALLFSLPLYYGADLNPRADLFFIFALTMYLVSVCYAQFYKLLTAVAVDGVLAKVLALFGIFMHLMFNGYVMPESQIPRGWIWLYWTNPATWALRILAQNEYLSSRPMYDIVVPGRGRLGDVALEAMGFSTNSIYLGTGFIFLAGFALSVCALTAVCYTRIRHQAAFSHKPDADAIEASAASIDVASERSDLNSLHFEPVTLAFRDLVYTIPVGPKKLKETRQLLKGIHGVFEPGTLTALMGSSGAGKTTLMDVIAGRKTAGTIAGELFVNGHPMDRSSFNNLMGYCEQFDNYEDTSTVKETFMFCAALRMPADTTVAQREAFVYNVLQTLELTPKAHCQFGTLTQGERKRVTIGGELLSNPSILFLDEPTTGLDSRAATIVMECVKRIAQSGRTVVCTIHQPSTVLFELFDKLLLLKSGGEMVYYGSLGLESADMLAYFGQYQGVAPMAPSENPATYMLNCIGAGTAGAANGLDFAAEYQRSWLRTDNLQYLEQWTVPKGDVVAKTDQYSASFGAQCRALLGRQWTIYWRSPSFNRSRLILVVVLALVFTSMYAGQKVETVLDVMSRLVLLNVSSCFMCTSMLSAAIPFTMHMRGVYYRERMSNMYSPTAYMVVTFIVELVYICLLSAVYVHGLYWSVGFSSETTAWTWYWLIGTLAIAQWSFMGQLLAFAISTHQVAVLLAGAITGIWFVFAGFFIDGNTLVAGWKWMYWTCPFHYSVEAIIVTQFHGDTRIVRDVLSGTNVQVQTFVDHFFHGAYAYANRFDDLVALLVMIVIVQGLIWLCMSKVCHLER
ncbi:ATP-binding Cassette (ABC) Superfamily [Achlya hypogyna]|uniref:ATP-binding Cassette (ABC) Superfamily n=1 Tax=Achlya hypogyna TaxID=1202772 RepID=A0A1V9Z2M5_ACHHY|nr:ATP-binding Cassette (ABC) Superfamily [Achlya hypogyna]